ESPVVRKLVALVAIWLAVSAIRLALDAMALPGHVAACRRPDNWGRARAWAALARRCSALGWVALADNLSATSRWIARWPLAWSICLLIGDGFALRGSNCGLELQAARRAVLGGRRMSRTP